MHGEVTHLPACGFLPEGGLKPAEPHQRDQLVAQTAEEKAARLRLAVIAARAAGSLANVDIPGWESSEAASAWVRSNRRADDEWRVTFTNARR
jgi:hypothetical protein